MIQSSRGKSTAAGSPPAIAVVLTCHERRAQTLACLQALAVAATRASASLRMIVVDDASRDGTAAAVRARWPEAQVIDGSGDLFWNRGMHRGIEAAMALEVDHLLWLNDDTLLFEDAIERLMRESRRLRDLTGGAVLLAGCTQGDQGQWTYGGSARDSRWRRLHFSPVWSATEPLRCDVVNGNCVLVPVDLARRVGNLDPVFEHAMGDTDYALRARQAGFGVYACSGYVGRCNANAATGTWTDPRLPLRVRWRAMLGRKGLPWRSWLHFTRRHGGWMWPLYFAWPYVRLLVASMAGR